MAAREKKGARLSEQARRGRIEIGGGDRRGMEEGVGEAGSGGGSEGLGFLYKFWFGSRAAALNGTKMLAE